MSVRLTSPISAVHARSSPSARCAPSAEPPLPRVVLYLDIDDTLVRHPPSGPRPAPGAAEFLAWALDTFHVRWLTRWCRDGIMREELVHSFCKMLDADPETIRTIRGLDWSESASKLDGIAWLEHLVLGRPFLWIEDEHGLGDAERAFVELQGFTETCLCCNVTEDPEALRTLHRELVEREGHATVAAAPGATVHALREAEPSE